MQISPPSYVCFRPDRDAFVIVKLHLPLELMWKEAEDQSGEIQASRAATLYEYREGIFYTIRDAFGQWWRSGRGTEPMFAAEMAEGLFKGVRVHVDGSEISIDYPFTNEDNGATQYSLTIRRSTGRFIETFVSEKNPATTYSGSCLVYR